MNLVELNGYILMDIFLKTVVSTSALTGQRELVFEIFYRTDIFYGELLNPNRFLKLSQRKINITYNLLKSGLSLICLMQNSNLEAVFKNCNQASPYCQNLNSKINSNLMTVCRNSL